MTSENLGGVVENLLSKDAEQERKLSSICPDVPETVITSVGHIVESRTSLPDIRNKLRDVR